MARVKRPDDHCAGQDVLSAYLDGELRPGELDEVVAHLAECLDCVAEFHRIKEMRAALRTLPELELPERLLPSTHPGPELSALLDGELATVEQEIVLLHLGDCTNCRAEFHELDAARTAIRSLPGLEPPEFLMTRRDAARARHRSRWRVATAAAAGMAAAAAIAVGVFGGPPPTSSIDVSQFSDQHNARASLEPGFGVIPVFLSQGEAP
jgi:anti-sigma factor RsiW